MNHSKNGDFKFEQDAQNELPGPDKKDDMYYYTRDILVG